jgi:hypothetical protein
MLRYSKWSLSLRFAHQVPVRTSHHPTCTTPGRLIFHKFVYKTNKMIQYTGVLFHLILCLVYLPHLHIWQ